MIKFSNGHVFEYMSASGALGYDGQGWPWEKPWRYLGLLDSTLFTSVTKTLTLEPTKGNLRRHNPFRCLRLVRGGVLNAVGLSNPGIDWWCETIGPKIETARIPLVVSIFGEPAEVGKMARRLNQFNLVGLEINVSCPNVRNCDLADAAKIIAICSAAKENSRHPLILKVSVGQDVQKIIEKAYGLIEAVAINSVPWKIVFPNRLSPLAHFGGGGISGKAAQPFTWALVRQLSRSAPIPIIGPSIWNFADLEKVRKAGAQAISFGSVFLRYPWRPTLYVRREQGLIKGG